MNRVNPRRGLPALVVVLAGCAGPTVGQYAGDAPAFEFERYFAGPVTAHGLFQKRDGSVVKRFVVSIQGTFAGADGTLDERFTYADGTTQRRIWHLHREADGRYSGRADDVVGVARGEVAGAAFHWQYTLRLPVDGHTLDVQFDDWMFRSDERVVLNHATMSKWGVRLGDVVLSFEREAAPNGR